MLDKKQFRTKIGRGQAGLLLLHAEIRVTLSHKNVAGAPYRIIVNAANSPQWLMSVAKGVTE